MSEAKLDEGRQGDRCLCREYSTCKGLEFGETSGNRGNQPFGVGHPERAGASEGPVAWPVGSGSASPLGPQPAPRSPQGPPRRSQGRPARAVVALPAGASNGPLGPSSGEWSPAALMCGRPARRQLVPPRRPRAPIDTHQAAGGRERPLPWAPLTVVPGPPARQVGAGWLSGGAPPGIPPVPRPRGSSPPLYARP